MFIDTHAHLDFPDFDNDREEVIRRAHSGGVGFIINISSSLEGCIASIDLAKRYEGVFASVGIHPHDAGSLNQDAFKRIEDLAASEKVIAVGEVGLDLYRGPLSADVQKEVFLRFVELSISLKLPLIIHSRQAEIETIGLLKKYSRAQLRAVVHCFSGSKDFLLQCLELGLDISFTCNITYKKSGALRELVKSVPIDRLLLETDCPYLPPAGMRGKRNEPANVIYLARKIAELRDCSIEEIAAKTTRNAKRLFNIK
jgi:TatD DNase family protein